MDEVERSGSVPKLNPHGLFIASYNEWWEATAIEPAEEYGRTYIDITKRYADTFKALRQLAGYRHRGPPALQHEIRERPGVRG